MLSFDFATWIETSIWKQESCAINGGYTTHYFHLEREPRQGAPISACVFILALEVLSFLVRNNKDIKKSQYFNIFDHLFYIHLIQMIFELRMIYLIRIILQKADKGNSVVLVNKADYTKRMKELLSDVSKFKEITVEPGKEINLLLQHEGKLIEFLKRVKSSFTTDLYKHLYPQGSQPGIMYGLSKIHKPLVNRFPNLRPILSAINTGTLFLCLNHLLLTIIQLRIPLISPKTSLNKIQNCLWLPLMWIPFSQTCHLMKLLKYVLTNYLNLVKRFQGLTNNKVWRCFR